MPKFAASLAVGHSILEALIACWNINSCAVSRIITNHKNVFRNSFKISVEWKKQIEDHHFTKDILITPHTCYEVCQAIV